MSKAQVDAKARAEGQCRLCRRPGDVRPLTRHRVVPGSYGGSYVAVNCVPLCRPCHDLVDHKDHTVRLPARRMLRASMWPDEIAHAQTHRGWRWVRTDPFGTRGPRWSFDATYPRPTREQVLARRRLSDVAV